jgi:hypothetical protein
MITSRLAVSVSTVLALAAFACSSAPSTDIGTGTPTKNATKTGDKPGTGNSTGTTPGGNTTDPAPSTPLQDTKACGQKTTSKACGDCCLASAPTALDAADQVWGECICAATACQTECSASICSTTDTQAAPTAACDSCLMAKGQACEDKAATTCDADPKCKAAHACIVTNCDPIAQKEAAAAGSGAMPETLRAARLTSYRQQ